MSIRKLLLSTTASALLLPAVIGSGVFAADQVVATVDMAKVLRNFEAVKKAVGYIKEKKDEYQKVIDGLQEEIRAINTDIQQEKEKGKDIKDREGSKRKKIFELQQKYQQLRDKLDKMEAEEFDQIKDRIKIELDKLVQKKGIGLVIEKQWLYSGASMDLTEDLLASLGATSGGAGAPAPKKRSGKPAPAADGQ